MRVMNITLLAMNFKTEYKDRQSGFWREMIAHQLF